jgi:hypothetical protein
LSDKEGLEPKNPPDTRQNKTPLENILLLWYNLIVTINKNNLQEPNISGTSVDVFAEYYNKNIPHGFPRATPKALAKFHKRYPSLFNEDNKWIINKHRKKFMDWLVSYREE